MNHRGVKVRLCGATLGQFLQGQWELRLGAPRLCSGCHDPGPLVSSRLRFTSWVAGPPTYASTQLSATDVSARTTMKDAAKCDKHCELQNSVNQQGFERILRFRDIPESMPASVSIPSNASDTAPASVWIAVRLGVSVRQGEPSWCP